MRPRKFTKINVEDFVKFDTKKVQKRTNQNAFFRYRDLTIHREVFNMFNSYGVKPEDEGLRGTGVSLAPTKIVKAAFRKEIVYPTSYDKINNSMSKVKKVGKNFAKKVIYLKEEHIGIDWQNYGSRKRPEEVFESLKECYII